MNTASKAVDRESLNAFPTARYKDRGDLSGIAARLAMTLLELAGYAMRPDVVAAVDPTDKITHRRADFLALRTDGMLRFDTIVLLAIAESLRDREAVRKAANDTVNALRLSHDAAYKRFSQFRCRAEKSRAATSALNVHVSSAPDPLP